MTKKILVTGGMGYIGSHTVVELQRSGFEPVILDNLSNSDPRILRLIARITGAEPAFEHVDVCDTHAMAHCFSRHGGFDGVIHFAARKAVGESVEHPLLYYHNNISGLITLLQQMRATDSNNLVFSSSSTVYGQPAELPVTEKAPVQEALSPYGNTKQISEEIIHDVTGSTSIRAVSLRYFNPIGAQEGGLLGELPTGIPNNLVPFITQTAIGKRDRLTVFGNDYDTPDGTCIRDFIHVCDLARAHVMAFERMLAGDNETSHEVFNIGTGRGYSVLEAIKSFEKVSGIQLQWEFSDRRPGDVAKVWADTTLANLKLGWKAEKGIDEMMKSAWQWERSLHAGILEQP